MWVNRNARYPYVSEATWFTRYHLLGRKIERQGAQPTANDRRTAAILVASAPKGAVADAAVTSMEWITRGE